MNDTDKHLRDLWVSVVEAADKSSTALITYSSGTPQVTEGDSNEGSSFASIQVRESHQLRNTILVLLFIFIILLIAGLVAMISNGELLSNFFNSDILIEKEVGCG